jgi:hypothetical protein
MLSPCTQPTETHQVQAVLFMALALLTFAHVGALESSATAEPSWHGQPGIVESVEQIMARSPRDTDSTRVTHSPKRWEEDPARLRHNPKAPDIAQWPISGGGGGDFPLIPQTVGVNFLGAQLSEASAIPPDSMGAVGPSQVLVIVNNRIKVFSKAGGLGPLNTTTDAFFNSVRSSNTSDPHVRYDRLTQRWFITMIDIASVNRVLIAVSSGPVISGTSSFTFYQFQHDQVGTTPNSDTGHFCDYDMLGVDRFALYIGGNIFSSISGGPIIGTTAYIVNKSNLLSGTLTVAAFRQIGAVNGTGNGPWSPQGVDNDDPAATEGYFIGVDRNLSGTLYIRRISDPGGSPSISGNLTITVPATSAPISQAHKGNTFNKNLDSLGTRLFAATVHRNKIDGTTSLWTAHNIQVDNTGVAVSSGGRNGSRWYEIGNLTSTPTLVQSGTLFDSTNSNPRGFWIPSVAASGQGHMALGCSYAGSNDFAGVATAGRLRTDPLGSTQPPTLAVVSTTSYNLTESPNPHRWGDYSQTVVDPTDDMTMWTFQEYCNSGDSWGVRAIQLRAPLPAYPISVVPATLTVGQTNIDVSITATSISGSEFFDPGPDTGGPGFPNHIKATVSPDVTVNSVTYVNTTNMIINVSVAPGAVAGARPVTVINPDGRSTNNATGILTILAPPIVTADPTNTTVGQNFDATFGVTIVGTAPLSYQWRFNSTEIPGATDSTFTRNNSQCANAGNYDVVVTNYLGAITSAVATLTVVAPASITSQPTNRTVFLGQTASFSVVATNQCGSSSFVYQWSLEGTNLPGATTSRYGISSAQLTDAGGYSVTISNISGSVTSAVAVLNVVAPPTITVPPQSVTLAQGSNANFFVVASGTQPLSYQWRSAFLPIPGATASAYARTNAQCADASGYDVVVTNNFGAVTSSIALLTVVAQPFISSQPTNQTVAVGQPFAFTVGATNDCGPLAYQWRFQGTNLSGATSNAYSGANAQLSDAGPYTVVVSNLAGAVTSSVATLTVLSPPVIVVGPLNGTDFVFSFATIPGKTYIIQYKDVLSDPVWQTQGSVPGDGTVQFVTNSLSAGTSRFFRLSVQ